MKLVKAFLADQSGGTAIEYGLIAGLLGLGIVVSMAQIREGMFQVWSAIKNGLGSG
jgi:Flp pilus assembly pilin Flp